MYRLSKASLDKLIGVHPDLISVVKKAITITEIDFRVTQGLRTVDEQERLYAQGRTAPGKIVTWTMKSRHLTGHAVDLCAIVNGLVSWDQKHYPLIADAMKQAAQAIGITIVWGGDWVKKTDMPHFELDSRYYK